MGEPHRGAANASVSIDVFIRAGWIIDLSGRAGPPHIISSAVQPKIIDGEREPDA